MRNVPDTMVVDTTVSGASYRLLYKGASDFVYSEFDQTAPFSGNGKALLAVGDWPTGTYRMVAQQAESTCVDTLPGEVIINHLERPYPGVLSSERMEYCLTEEENLRVSIGLEGAIAGTRYRLFRMVDGNVELVATELHNGSETSILFGEEFNARGRYFSVADNGSCQDTAGYLLIGELPKNPIRVVAVDTGYCAGETTPVSLKLYPAPAEVHYYIYPAGYGSSVAECTAFEEDSVRYTGILGQGRYVIKAQVASCEEQVGTFTIREYALPYSLDLLEPTDACEGTNLAMGVAESQEKILYKVHYEEPDKDPVLKSQKTGDGKDLVLLTSDRAGV